MINYPKEWLGFKVVHSYGYSSGPEVGQIVEAVDIDRYGYIEFRLMSPKKNQREMFDSSSAPHYREGWIFSRIDDVYPITPSAKKLFDIAQSRTYKSF